MVKKHAQPGDLVEIPCDLNDVISGFHLLAAKCVMSIAGLLCNLPLLQSEPACGSISCTFGSGNFERVVTLVFD